MSVYAIRSGHSDNCRGAAGVMDERTRVKRMYYLVTPKLEQAGHTVVCCNSNASTVVGELNEGTNQANTSNAEFFASLHQNACNGQAHGAEVWTYDKNNAEVNAMAKQILQNLAELGYVNRGIKCSKNLHDLNATNMPAMIIEICFCDSQEDYNLYYEDKVADAIAFGLQKKAVKREGWIEDQYGWWYKNPDGSYPTGWKFINNNWFYFEKSGYAYRSCWLKDKDGNWYYFNSECIMVRGWAKINGHWYYLNETANDKFPGGAAVTGFFEDDDHLYYGMPFNDGTTPEAAAAVGWKVIDGVDYFFTRQGSELTPTCSMACFTFVPSAEDPTIKYFLKANGQMAKNESVLINGRERKFDDKGRLIS